MIDQLRRQANMCRSALVRRKRLNAARRTAEIALGRPATQAELAERMEISHEELLREIDATQGVHYENLDEIYSDHSERSEEHTSELQSLMRISNAVICLKK